MTKMVKTSELAPAARVALINTPMRQGSIIPGGTSEAVRNELDRHGLIGPLAGLTRAGTIVRARCLDEAIADVGDPDSVERSVVVGNVQDAMADAIENFSPAQRSVVVLRYYVGMDFPMIAAELGVSVMNVRTIHSEAIYLLHDVMKDAAK